MKKALLIIACLSTFSFQSCVKEEIVLVPQDPARMTAELNYSYYTGIRTVEVEGEIINRGNVPIAGSQLRFRLFDKKGYLITTYFQEFVVNSNPGYGTYFYADFPEISVYEVKVDIWDLW